GYSGALLLPTIVRCALHTILVGARGNKEAEQEAAAGRKPCISTMGGRIEVKLKGMLGSNVLMMMCKLQRDATVRSGRNRRRNPFPHSKRGGNEEVKRFSTSENEENLHQMLKTGPIFLKSGLLDSLRLAEYNSI